MHTVIHNSICMAKVTSFWTLPGKVHPEKCQIYATKFLHSQTAKLRFSKNSFYSTLHYNASCCTIRTHHRVEKPELTPNQNNSYFAILVDSVCHRVTILTYLNVSQFYVAEIVTKWNCLQIYYSNLGHHYSVYHHSEWEQRSQIQPTFHCLHQHRSIPMQIQLQLPSVPPLLSFV